MAKINPSNYTPYFPLPQIARASVENQQLSEFLELTKVPGFIERHKNYILATQFEQILGQSPFTIDTLEGYGVADIRPDIKPIEEKYDEPEKEIFRNIWNRLATGKGKLERDNFLNRAFKSSMTGGWLNFLGLDNFDPAEGIDITEDGIYYDNKKLNVSPETEKIIYDYVNTLQKSDASFWEKAANTAVSLMMDLPLMFVTGAVASKAIQAVPTLAAMAKSSSTLARFSANAAQQALNFNILGVPQTVDAVKNQGLEGGLNSIWHSAQMGIFASLTGEMGRFAFTSVPKVVVKGNPVLREELGTLAGSFGFGYGSTKLQGGSDEDALATGLAFAATHFTNPRAYSRVIREQKLKNVEIYQDIPRDIDGIEVPYDTWYYVKEGNKLYPIDAKQFQEYGNIVKTTETGVEFDDILKKYVVRYNEAPSSQKISLGEALVEERTKKIAKQIYKDLEREIPKEIFNEKKDVFVSLSKGLAIEKITADMANLFSRRWKLPKDWSVTNELINLNEELQGIPFPEFKRMLNDDILEFVKNPGGYEAKLKSSGMDENVQKTVLKGLEVVKQGLINEKVVEDPFFFSKSVPERLLEYYELMLDKTNPEDAGGIAYYKNRIEKIKERIKEERPKKTYEGEIPIIGKRESAENKLLLAEIERLKRESEEEARIEASRRALKALQGKEPTTAEALQGKTSLELPVEKPATTEKPQEQTVKPEKGVKVREKREYLDEETKNVIEKGLKKYKRKPATEYFTKEPATEDARLLRETIADDLNRIERMTEEEPLAPEFYIVNRLRDRGYGELKIAKLLHEIGFKPYADLDVSKIRNKVRVILKRQSKRLQNEYAKYEKVREILDKDIAEQKKEGKTPEQIIEETEPAYGAELERKEADEAGYSIIKPTSRKNKPSEEYRRDEVRIRKLIGFDKPIDINTEEGQQKLKEAIDKFNKQNNITERDQEIFDKLINEVLGLDEDITSEQNVKRLYSNPEIPEPIKRRFDKSKWNLTPEQIKTEVERINNEFKKINSDWKAEYDETLDQKGYTDFVDKVIKIGKSATIDTPHHELLHAATTVFGKRDVWARFLREEGWDGKGDILDLDNPTLRNAHEILAKDFADFRLGYTPDREGIFSKIANFFKRIGRLLKGQGWYSKYDYFRMLINGQLPRQNGNIEPRMTTYAKLYSLAKEGATPNKKYPGITGRSIAEEYEEYNVYGYLNGKAKVVDIDKFAKNIKHPVVEKAQANAAFIKWFRQTSTPPHFMAKFYPQFAEIHRPLEEKLVRGVPRMYNKILLDPEGWAGGKHFRTLPKEDVEALMNANKQWERDVYDGIAPSEISIDEFVQSYGLSDRVKDVILRYQRTVKKSLEVAREGVKEKLFKHNNSLASTFLTDEDLAHFFGKSKTIGGVKIRIKDKESGKWIWDKTAIDSIINNDESFKEEVVEYLAEKIYPDFGDRYFFSSVRPVDRNTWIIEARRPSDNPNHEPVRDPISGEIVGHEEKIRTYAKRVQNKKGTSWIPSKQVAERIAEGLKAEGYRDIKLINIGEEIKKGRFWNKLTPDELISLANQGMIPLDDPTIQKLFKVMNAGRIEQHFLHKRFVPGLWHTPEEFEDLLQRFVRLAVNSNYRQNAILDARESLRKWQERLSSGELPPDKLDEEKKLFEYAVKYYNNVTTSDASGLDWWRQTVTSFYTALKMSFFVQQSLQGLQTTMHLAIAEAEKGGFKKFLQGTKKAFDVGINNIIGKKERLPFNYKPKNEDEERMAMMQELDDAGLLGRTYREELFGDATDDIMSHYMYGIQRKGKKLRYAANMMSAAIERFTRIQSFNTFYDIGKERGLEGEELFHYIADKIHESMGEWGAAGRPPIFASSFVGKAQHPLVKALDKFFYTFKTFSTHNLGLYEYLYRQRRWDALLSKFFVGIGIHGALKFPLMATMFAIANMFTDDDLEYETIQYLEGLNELVGGKIGGAVARGLPVLGGVNMAELMNEQSPFASDLFAESYARSWEGKIADVMLGAPAGYARDAITALIAGGKSLHKRITGEAITKEERIRLDKAMSRIAPLALKNILTVLYFWERNGVTVGGKPVILSDEISEIDKFYKAMGFNPIDIQRTLEEQFHGIPAKIKRTTYKIRELRRIRSEINKSKDYTREEKQSQIQGINQEIRELYLELSELRRQQFQQKTRGKK